jgi:hypothetical protein
VRTFSLSPLRTETNLVSESTSSFNCNMPLSEPLIFGPKRDEVAGGWRRLHNEELHNLYTSPDIIRVNRSRRMR